MGGSNTTNTELTETTVLQYGKAFHASSLNSRAPLGAKIRTHLGTLLEDINTG